MRIVSVFATFILGIGLIFLGFLWIQGNMTLPGELHRYLWERLSWPWLPFDESSVIIRALLDESLVCLFLLLTFLLNHFVGQQKFIPARYVRSTQLSITGLLFFTVVSCWHHTGIIVWDWTAPFLGTLNFALFFGLLALSLLYPLYLNPQLHPRTWTAALGLEQLYSSEIEAQQLTQPFKLQGISLSLMAGAILIGTPMSLDRLLFALPVLLIAMTTWLKK
jgi:hypothetical protein